MANEFDREISTNKVPSNPNTSIEEQRSSAKRITKLGNDNNAVGLILVILIPLAIGAGVAAYFLYNNRPSPPQIVVPNANNTVKENKSTVIERNNTTIREVSPATPQPTPTVEINLPVTITEPPAVTPVPKVTVTVQPTANPVATPKTITQPQSATPSPSSTN